MAKNIKWELITDWSHEKAWWLGLVYSDGCVHYAPKNGNYLVSLCGNINTSLKWAKLISDDIHPQEFKRSKGTYQTIIYSKELVIWFNNTYNIRGKKSNTITWPHDLPNELRRSFIRGLYDGDGSLFVIDPSTKNRYGRLSYTCKIGLNSENLIQSLQKEIHRDLSLEKTKITQCKKNESINYVLKYAGIPGFKLAEYIYKDSPKELRNDLKYEIYQWMEAFLNYE